MGSCCCCCPSCSIRCSSSDSAKTITHTSQVVPVAPPATQYTSPFEPVKQEPAPKKEEPQDVAQNGPTPAVPELVPPPPVTVEVTEANLTSILPNLEPSANPDQAPPPPPPPPPASGPLAPPPPPSQGMQINRSYQLF